VAAATLIPNIGRTVTPWGRMTSVGNLPTGGALTPDGRFYWSVSAGDGRNDVRIVNVASGEVVQVLPMPGTYGQMAFSPDGTAAYVSGEPNSSAWQPAGPTVADSGGAIHVFKVDAVSGSATEQAPITLAAGASGYPTGIAVSPDGKTLVVALYHASKAAIIDTASNTETSEIGVGNYPFAARFERSGQYAYVSNAQDGTLSKIDPASGKVVATISGLGGPSGDYNAQPQYLLADPKADVLYVAVTNHDGVAVLDTQTDTVTRFVSLLRPEGFGAAPVALALAPDEQTLYVANAGENAVAAIALTDRGSGGAKAWSVIGKIPTADYTQDVAVTPDNCTLVWTSARGLGAGPNPGYGVSWENSYGAPYGTYVPDMLIGRVGILPLPGDAGFAGAAATVEASIVPGDGSGKPAAAPADTPLAAAGGGASDKIKYVFLVVKENRTYDQIFGSVPRGDGDQALEVAEDNCGAQNTAFEGADRKHPGCGTTPNAHALSRMFVLLDRFFEDSEVSVDGHMITSSSYATNSLLKAVPANYTGRNTSSDTSSAVSLPPKYFLFDQAARQGVSFRNYGEATAIIPSSGSDRGNYAQVLANTDLVYVLGYATAASFACADFKSVPGYPNLPTCTFDSGMGAPPPLAGSHIDEFNAQFQLQLLSGTVPHFNYFTMPDDHTNGTGAGLIQPLSEVADNDLGVGQLVQIISHSSIWPQSAIFVVEDDSQDGADHYEAHRAPALVISPWVRHGGAAVHTHYDQYSVLRTIELILGLDPLSIYDANAAPMYDLFSGTPDNTAYSAITPERSLVALNPANAANAQLSAALPFDRPDAVPQELADRILWQSVFGKDSVPPAPGPHASLREHQRAVLAMDAYLHGRDVRAALRSLGDDD
jgi:YVTN family beta-propeller protein